MHHCQCLGESFGLYHTVPYLSIHNDPLCRSRVASSLSVVLSYYVYKNHAGESRKIYLKFPNKTGVDAVNSNICTVMSSSVYLSPSREEYTTLGSIFATGCRLKLFSSVIIIASALQGLAAHSFYF